ncbi:MAG: folate-binding protein YgfZ [Gammaproteobacteria bacterium]|nr:folate-binding protein YgfZ [Gammaproteobacteria bacterium]
MSNNWCNFLTPFGATFNKAQEVSFNSPESTPINSLQGELYLTDLSYLGLIEVTGDDKKTYLQGQLTNDINAISSSLSQLSGLCTPKGRLRVLFSIFTQGDKIYLQLPVTLIEETIKRLKMFVMMSKVELKIVDDTMVKIGLFGTQAINKLKENGFTIPAETNMVTQNNGMLLIRQAGDIPRFECIGSIETIQTLWQSLHSDSQLIDTEHWKLQEIQAGTPNVFSSSKEAFIPQMLNLQVLNGINFKKGCYTGQEVVARMQYLGKLKRQMYLAQCDSDTVPQPGDELFSASCQSGQGAGHIVDAQRSLQGGIELLAVITKEAIENSDIFLDESLKQALDIQELPYSVQTEAES